MLLTLERGQAFDIQRILKRGIVFDRTVVLHTLLCFPSLVRLFRTGCVNLLHWTSKHHERALSGRFHPFPAFPNFRIVATFVRTSADRPGKHFSTNTERTWPGLHGTESRTQCEAATAIMGLLLSFKSSVVFFIKLYFPASTGVYIAYL